MLHNNSSIGMTTQNNLKQVYDRFTAKGLSFGGGFSLK